MTPTSSADRSPRRRGTVYLVGAGPGDPGLLTVHAHRLLRRADVVIHDALIGREILELVPAGARLLDVGKRCGGRRTSQERINELLIEAAAEARVVVRLKGGDPFVFGRGGEEALALVEAGIRFRVVPGVTSGVGVSAYAGIPLTHRDFASAVTFVTGHEDTGRSQSRIDWDALARVEGTLVVYMGLGSLAKTASKLISAGRDPDTPAALVEWGTLARQRSVTSPLREIAAAGKRAGIGAPALVVIGEVASLREQLSWFDKLPLRGKRVVVARSRPQKSRIAASLSRLGAEVVEYPKLRSEPADLSPSGIAVLGRLREYGWIVFTSPAGVRHFWDRLKDRRLDARALAGARIASFGVATTRALRKRGIEPEVAARTFDVEAVAESLAQVRLLEGARVLFPREANLPSAIANDLRERGVALDELPLFRTTLDHGGSPEDLATADFIVLPSSFAAAALARGLGDRKLTGKVVAIGPGTAQTALGFDLPVHEIPERATAEGVVKAVRKLATQMDRGAATSSDSTTSALPAAVRG